MPILTPPATRPPAGRTRSTPFPQLQPNKPPAKQAVWGQPPSAGCRHRESLTSEEILTLRPFLSCSVETGLGLAVVRNSTANVSLCPVRQGQVVVVERDAGIERDGFLVFRNRIVAGVPIVIKQS